MTLDGGKKAIQISLKWNYRSSLSSRLSFLSLYFVNEAADQDFKISVFFHLDSSQENYEIPMLRIQTQSGLRTGTEEEMEDEAARRRFKRLGH